MPDTTTDKPKLNPADLINPTDAYMDTVAKYYDKFYRWRLSMTNEWKQLQGYQLPNYVRSARNKMYGFEPISTEQDLNERPVFLTHEYRVQAEQILTSIANLTQNPRFYSSEGLNFQIAEVLNGLHHYATKGVNYKLNTLLDYWHTVMDGTLIKYVSYAPHRRKVKNIKSVDLTTGAIKYEEIEIKEGEVQEKMVDISSFYIPKIFEPDIQKQGECIWVDDMTYSDFKDAFKDYPNAHAVVPGTELVTDSIFARMLDKSVLLTNRVQVLKAFNWITDEYVLMANGVWINPNKGSKDEISPMPWNHKMAPFAKTTYRFIDANFFYGAALPHLVKSPIEAREELQEMKLDRIFRTLNPPMLTTEPTIPEGFKLEGGAVYKTNVSPTEDWRELQQNELDQNAWRMDADLDSMTGRIALPTPMSAPSGGGDSKQPKAAAERIQQQAQQAMSFNFQKLFFQHLMEQKALLTVENMLQFFTSVDMEKTIGEKKYLNIMHIEGVPLKSGISNVELRFVKSNKSLSDHATLMKQRLFHAIFNHENRHIIEASYEIFKDLNFEVEMQFEPEQTPELKKAMFMDFLGFMNQTFGQQIDQNKAMFRAFEVWNENPADWLPDQTADQYPSYLAGVTPKQQGQQGQNPMAAQLAGNPGGPQGGPGPGGPQGGGGGLAASPTLQRVKQSMLRGPASGRGNVKFGQGGGVNIAAMVK